MLLRGEAADIQFLDDLVGIGANRLAVAQMRAEELLVKSPLICIALNTTLFSIDSSSSSPTPRRSSDTMAMPFLSAWRALFSGDFSPNSSTSPVLG